MSYVPQLFTIAGVMLLACISPGPDLLAVTSHALHGKRAGVGVALGVAASHMAWAILAVFGLGVIVSELAWLYEAIRFAGALYLLYLGARILLGLRHAAVQSTPIPAARKSFSAAWRKGFLVGITNPKGAAFFGSLFVTILPAHAPLWVHGTTVLIVASVSCSWFVAMALLLSTARMRTAYARVRRPIDALMGTMLVGLGLRLALDR